MCEYKQDAVSQICLMGVDKNDHVVDEILRKIEGIKESVLKSYDGRLADPKILKMAKRDFAEGIIPYQKMLTEYLATRPTTSFNIEFSDIDKIIKM